jgi:hypothetical protein
MTCVLLHAEDGHDVVLQPRVRDADEAIRSATPTIRAYGSKSAIFPVENLAAPTQKSGYSPDPASSRGGERDQGTIAATFIARPIDMDQ